MLLAVRISSYGCTWEVWRALKKHLSCIFRAPQTSRVHPQLDIRTLSMTKFSLRGRRLKGKGKALPF